MITYKKYFSTKNTRWRFQILSLKTVVRPNPYTHSMGSSVLRQNWWKVFLYRKALYISQLLFVIVTRLSHSIFRIVKRSYIHKLQLGFVNIFIAPIRFSCFTTLNVMYLSRSVHAVVVLNCCYTWASKESCFFVHFWEGVVHMRNDHPLFSWMSDRCYLYIYLHTSSLLLRRLNIFPVFTFVNTIAIYLRWNRPFAFCIH